MGVAERIRQTASKSAEPAPAPKQSASINGRIPAPDLSADEAVAQVTGNEESQDTPVAEDKQGLSDLEIADLMDDDDDADEEVIKDVDEVGADELGTETEVVDEGEEAEPGEEPAGEELEAEEPEVEPEEEVPAVTPEASTEQQVPTPEQEAPKQKTAEEIQAEYTEAYSGLVDQLASTTYALTEDEAQALITEPETILPKLAARIHAEVLVQTAQGIMQKLPSVLTNFNNQQAAENKYKDAFFGAWPQLAKHEEAVRRVGQVYRQLNPNVSPEQAIQEIGAQTMVMLKIPFTADTPPAENDVTHTPPPRPAQPGGARQAAPKPKLSSEEDEWSKLAREFEEEDAS